jgi:arylamine N-acetyltransferase
MTLQHSAADVVRWLLVALGLGGNPTVSPLPAWPVYKGAEPNTPDDVITIRDTSGRLVGAIQHSGEWQEYYGIQVRVRSTTDPVGFARVELIRDTLDRSVLDQAVTVDGVTYCVHAMTRVGGVMDLGNASGSKRIVWTVNYLADLRRAG